MLISTFTVQPFQKNSASRAASSGTESGHGKSKHSVPSAPRPSARTKQSAQKQKTTTTKVCNVQYYMADIVRKL